MGVNSFAKTDFLANFKTVRSNYISRFDDGVAFFFVFFIFIFLFFAFPANGHCKTIVIIYSTRIIVYMCV